jgi:Xaa-Pro aminopeptidase
MADIKGIQAELRASKVDGWLFYDHHHRDLIAAHVLGLATDGMATRRWFYFVPKKGDPRKLVHRIERGALDSLAGKRLEYSSWQELHAGLRKLLAGSRTIAMQYSPKNNIPYIGLVDAGTVELVRKLKKRVVSSADLVQTFEAAWTPEQLKMHLEAGHIVDHIVRDAFRRATDAVRNAEPLSEYELQQWILQQFRVSKLTTDEPPVVAVQPNNANPHYEPTKTSSRAIRAGDLLLLDVWGKCDFWASECPKPMQRFSASCAMRAIVPSNALNRV